MGSDHADSIEDSNIQAGLLVNIVDVSEIAVDAACKPTDQSD